MWREGWVGDVAKAKTDVRPTRRKPADLRKLIRRLQGAEWDPALLGQDQDRTY